MTDATIIRSVDEMPLMMTAEDIAATGLCGRNKAYDFLNTAGFPVIKVGRKLVVPKDAFLAWVHSKVEKETGFTY